MKDLHQFCIFWTNACVHKTKMVNQKVLENCMSSYIICELVVAIFRLKYLKVFSKYSDG